MKSSNIGNCAIDQAHEDVLCDHIFWAPKPFLTAMTASILVLWLMSLSGCKESSWHSAAESSAHGSPLIALIEVTRAATYVRAARAVASDADIENECGVDIQTFVRQVETLESQVLGSVSESPALAPTIT